MKNKVLLILASAVVIFSIMACSLGDILGGGEETETPVVNTPVVVVPTNTPMVTVGGLDILSTSSFTDSYGAFHVFGEVVNNTDAAVSSIELSISIADASGATILKDDDGNPAETDTFYPMLWTLDVGESSPFSFYFDTENGIPANYEVTVTDFSDTTVNRGDLETQNVDIVEDGSGYYVLTGELVNLGSDWVHISGLSGGVLDDNNTVLSADWTGTYTTLLAPTGDEAGRDRTPFYVSFPVSDLEATQWSMWWDADIETDVTDYPMVIEVTNSYFDQYGSVHLVGQVTNNSGETLTSLVVAGLYAEDGTVLDASYQYVALPVKPDLPVPFDVSYFSSVNWNDDQAARVDSYTVQVDPWGTYPPYGEDVGLTESGESITKNGASWTVTGTVNNTTTQNLSGITVLVAVYDASDTLVAMGYSYAYPDSDYYAPGDSDTYEIYLYLDPDADTSTYTTRTFVVGDVDQ